MQSESLRGTSRATLHSQRKPTTTAQRFGAPNLTCLGCRILRAFDEEYERRESAYQKEQEELELQASKHVTNAQKLLQQTPEKEQREDIKTCIHELIAQTQRT